MAKHRTQRRKRQKKRVRKSRRYRKKMYGGLVDTDRQVLVNLGFTDQDINYLYNNHGDMDILFFQNSVNGVPGNMFYENPQTPAQIMEGLRNINDEVLQADGAFSESGYTTSETIGSQGGKKRTKRRYRSRGGGFTVSEENEPYSYLDQREISMSNMK